MRLKQDVYLRLQRRLIHECTSTRSLREEMKELSSAYNQYVDCESRLQESNQRMSYLMGLLGPDRVIETMKADGTSCLRKTLESHTPPSELRDKLSLWRAIREYLREVPGKSKVGEIQDFLTWMGLENVTRQAIESALKRHSDWFKVTKRGHDRYVELK